MRLLKRHPETDTDDERAAAEAGGERTMVASDRTTTVPEADQVPPDRPARYRPVPDHAGPVVPDARTRAGDEPTVRTEAAGDTSRIAVVPERVATEEVVVTHWSVGDVLVALIGAALAAVGIIVLVRTGIDSTWYRPTTSIVGATHTPLLGAIEAGTGIVLALAAIARMRFLTTLIGLAMAVAGVVAAMETSEWSRELAIEDWWAWTLAGVGLVVALLALVPRRGHVDRIVRPA